MDYQHAPGRHPAHTRDSAGLRAYLLHLALAELAALDALDAWGWEHAYRAEQLARGLARDYPNIYRARLLTEAHGHLM